MAKRKTSSPDDTTSILHAASWHLPEDCEKLDQLIRMIPDAALILDCHRKTVMINAAMLKMLELNNTDEALGKTPGKLFHCLYEYNSQECGSTKFCRYCGASEAIDASDNGSDIRSECTITDVDMNIRKFMVWSHPLRLNKTIAVLFVIRSLDDETKRQTLEHQIFSRMLNMLSNINVLLPDTDTESLRPEIVRNIRKITSGMADGIESIQELINAESHQIKAVISPTDSLSLLRDAAGFFAYNPLAEGQQIIITGNAENIELATDARLVRRVLLCMIKNALEAGKPGDIVMLCCFKKENRAIFTVFNKQYISAAVQKHLFQKTFSSKEVGCGYGTYLMKRFAEDYLGGTIEYQTAPRYGTTFKLLLPL